MRIFNIIDNYSKKYEYRKYKNKIVRSEPEGEISLRGVRPSKKFDEDKVRKDIFRDIYLDNPEMLENTKHTHDFELKDNEWKCSCGKTQKMRRKVK